MSALYGRGDAQTLVENCGNSLILRCSASEGGGKAQFASQLIGQREVSRRHVSRTDARDGTSVLARRRRSPTESEQVIVEPAVLPAEIEQLPDLAASPRQPRIPTTPRATAKPTPCAAGLLRRALSERGYASPSGRPGTRPLSDESNGAQANINTTPRRPLTVEARACYCPDVPIYLSDSQKQIFMFVSTSACTTFVARAMIRADQGR